MAIGLSLVLPFLATAATVSVPATASDIQDAINAASPGDVIEIAAGTVTLDPGVSIVIPNPQLGITLRGAGAGATIIERSSGGTSNPLLMIGASTSCATGAATVIEGITFRNSGLTSGSATSSTAAYRGIEIRSCGASPADPAIIRDCEFLEFRDTGISIVDYPFAYWEFTGNTFDGSRLAIWINQADFVTIHRNTFRDYVVAMGFDPNDVVTDLAITENKMLGGSFDPAPANYYGLYVSAAAMIAGESKKWDISGNEITGATYGIRLLAPTSGGLFQSLTDVSVHDNCIYDNNVLGSGGSTTSYGVYNTSTVSLDAIDNWWGDASGPAHASNPSGTGDVVSDLVNFSPWSTFTLPACGGAVVKPFVFLADYVVIERSKQIPSQGDIHSNGKIDFLRGDPTAFEGNLTAVGKITIGKENTIDGYAHSAGIVSVHPTSQVLGGTISGAPISAQPLPSFSYTAGGASKTIPQNGTLTLAPGSYNVVTMNGWSTLKLSSGDYYLNQLKYLGEEAVIEIDVSNGPVTVNVVSNLQLGKDIAIQIVPDGEAGSTKVTFNTRQTTTMTIGKEAYVLGNINAPAATVVLSNNSQFRGTICAKALQVKRDVFFLHHFSSGTLPGPGDLPKSIDGESEETAAVVTAYELAQNYPNPFNPSTVIKFALPQAGRVQLHIYNSAGQLVRTLANNEMAQGWHELTWDGRDQNGQTVATGVYLYRLTAQDASGTTTFAETRRMTLVK
ncbi:right-handed parallel beta-helix repeat-containing protein [bacterium]|nr:right-handed parallel beta-helix repeat-containing protein [bacterium]